MKSRALGVLAAAGLLAVSLVGGVGSAGAATTCTSSPGVQQFNLFGSRFVAGTAGNDRIDCSGYTGFNLLVISGGAGADTIIGSSKSDLIDGNAGADVINGGPGLDVCALDPADRVTSCP